MATLTPEEAKADVLARLADTGSDHLHCSQAMVRFALLMMGQDLDLTTIGRYLGGGVAGMGEACGAITGAALALGLRDFDLPGGAPENEPGMTEVLQKLVREFELRFGARRCRDLTGLDMSEPGGVETYSASDAPERCASYISWMCDQLLPILEDPA
ncbi:MAG: C_GCAxxG_C_C family protein [Thermoleophilia bacterium]|nr:C_GCAxxG_C_C family protein [Thermoleophilia bacterium]